MVCNGVGPNYRLPKSTNLAKVYCDSLLLAHSLNFITTVTERLTDGGASQFHKTIISLSHLHLSSLVIKYVDETVCTPRLLARGQLPSPCLFPSPSYATDPVRSYVYILRVRAFSAKRQRRRAPSVSTRTRR